MRKRINIKLDSSTIFSTILIQSREKIRRHAEQPKDWQIADLEVIALRFGITLRRGKGSHVSFTYPTWVAILTIPTHKPVKPVYVKKFVSLIDTLKEEEI